MEKRTERLITALADQCKHLPQPIHLLAMCSGGKVVAKTIHKQLTSKGVVSDYFEVWTNTVRGKRKIWKTDFKKSNYLGTAVIVEDVIWQGAALPATRSMLRSMKRKRVYTASLLDCNGKADFSVFH